MVNKHVLVAGAHKTATTALQSFFSSDDVINDGSVFYVNHRHVRKNITKPAQVTAYHDLGMKWDEVADLDQAELASMLIKLQLTEKHKATLLVEENVLGHSGQVARTGNFYKFRERFSQNFAKSYVFPVNEIVYTIRKYSDFFESAYSEYIRSMNFEKEGNFISPEQFKAKVFKKMPFWWICIRTLGGAFPGAKFTLIEHESVTLSERAAEIYKLCGINVTDLEVLASPAMNAINKSKPVRNRLSQAAFEKIVSIMSNNDSNISNELMTRIIEDDSGETPMQIWTPEERKYLDYVYEADKKRIERGFPELEMNIVKGLAMPEKQGVQHG